MLQPRTDWAETIAPNEEAELVGYAEILRDLQRKHGRRGGVARALHSKGHAGVRAEVRTRGDLPAPLRVGIFAAAGTYAGYVRFSSGSGKRQSDRAGDVRGLALKIVGVPGTKLIPGMESARTQDFLLINTPSTPFRDAKEFVRIVQVANSPLLLLPTLVRLGPGRVLAILKQFAASAKAPTTGMAGRRFWSALPIRWGEHAARVSLIPASEAATEALGEGGDALREELAGRLRRGPLAWTLAAQLYVDPQRTPIEDGSAVWSEDDSPFVPVADVVLPQQDPASEQGRKLDAFVETLSFDPWHAPVEFRPLGNMMRARNHAYRLSVVERGAAGEPDGSETFV
jgi:hypothetical protein